MICDQQKVGVDSSQYPAATCTLLQNLLKMIKYPRLVEIVVSGLNLLFVVITFLWKTVGLSWVPFGLGQAWAKVLHPDGFFWPRHGRSEPQYLLFHLLLYCFGGTLAQLSSWKLVMDPTNQTARTFFGGFHVCIAIYHTVVSFGIIQGKCILLEKPIWSDYPFIRVCYQVMFTMELVVALNYLLSTGSRQGSDGTRHYQQQKTSLDMLSLSNFIPMLTFTLMISFLDFQDEWIAFWINATFYGILPFLLLSLECLRNWQFQSKESLKEKMQ